MRGCLPKRINMNMRDILNKLETLTESTGLAGRKPGDLFRNADGDEISFNELKLFPEEGGKLDQSQLDSVLADIDEQTGNSVQWMNNRTAKTGGFAIATFTGPEGPLYFGRYLENIKPNFTSNYVPNQVGEYRFAGKAAAKAQSGLTPQDLLTNKLDLTAKDIITQLAETLGTDNPLYQVAYKLASGEPLPMSFPVPEGVSFSAFRDYFCEILQPIALQMGQYEGNAGEAAEIFLGGSFQDTLISFDDTKTAGLSDSIMTNSEGKSIKVSTKGGKGATASAKNLINSVDELAKTENGQKLLDKYSEVIDMLRNIQKQGQAGSPLYLGIEYGIIDEDDAETVNSLKNIAPVTQEQMESMGLSPTLMSLAKGRKITNPESINLYFHLLASIAFKAADKVNEHTNFSKAAAEILNNGALVQVYTKAKEGKTEWTLNEFNTVYPGDSIKGVYLSADKTYYSTGIKGNFTFKIDKGEGKPKQEPNVDGPGREKRVTPSSAEFVKKASDIALGRDRPKISKTPDKMGGVGREKRK